MDGDATGFVDAYKITFTFKPVDLKMYPYERTAAQVAEYIYIGSLITFFSLARIVDRRSLLWKSVTVRVCVVVSRWPRTDSIGTPTRKKQGLPP